MIGTLAALATVAGLMLGSPAGAVAEGSEPARADYVRAAEQICKADTARSKRILSGAQRRINHGRLAQAGRQFTRVSQTYGTAVTKLMRLPRPRADRARLKQWFRFLRIVQVRLGILGRVLKAERKFQSNYAAIHVERAANTANNVGYPFGFRYCRFTRSRFG